MHSLRSKHFRRVCGAKIGVSATLMEVVGKGRRREKETLARKPHDFEKRPFDTFAVG